jgi:hypothetical protein
MITDYRRPKWFLYPGWVALSAISLLLAVAVYLVLISPIAKIVGDKILVGGQSRITEDFLLPYIFCPTLGPANGLLQYLLLRRYLPRMGWWIVATALGWPLALFGADRLYATLSTTFDVNSVWFVVVKIILTGGTIGLVQWFVLRQRVHHAAWWILANVLGWGISGMLSRWLDLWVFGAPAIATGVALWLLLDQLPRREGSGRNTPPNNVLCDPFTRNCTLRSSRPTCRGWVNKVRS